MTFIRPEFSSASDFDRFLRELFWNSDPSGAFSGRHLHPGTRSASLAADLYEDPNAYHVLLELPGVRKEDIRVELENAVLRVSGTHRETAESEESSYEFQRSLAVPPNVTAGDVSAKLEDGVLHVTLPKHEDSKPKSIAVS